MKDIFSCDDVCVMVMFQMDSVKYNFVKPFSPHVESVNDKKREALVPTVFLPLTISLSGSIQALLNREEYEAENTSPTLVGKYF